MCKLITCAREERLAAQHLALVGVRKCCRFFLHFLFKCTGKRQSFLKITEKEEKPDHPRRQSSRGPLPFFSFISVKMHESRPFLH